MAQFSVWGPVRLGHVRTGVLSGWGFGGAGGGLGSPAHLGKGVSRHKQASPGHRAWCCKLGGTPGPERPPLVCESGGNKGVSRWQLGGRGNWRSTAEAPSVPRARGSGHCRLHITPSPPHGHSGSWCCPGGPPADSAGQLPGLQVRWEATLWLGASLFPKELQPSSCHQAEPPGHLKWGGEAEGHGGRVLWGVSSALPQEAKAPQGKLRPPGPHRS